MDFNTRPLPYEDRAFKNIICEQVIEHLHNTTWFLEEINRILDIDGDLILSTENLASLPNIFAMLLGKAPFSLQQICGDFYGGWKRLHTDSPLHPSHPCFSGTLGHVRVMTKGQLKELLFKHGFKIKKIYNFMLGHYILFHCKKIYG